MHDIIELFFHLINPEWILSQPIAFWLILFIIFAETGLFVGFFLPGDSLLFVTGLHLADRKMYLGSGMEVGIVTVVITVTVAAVLGNTLGYWFGKKSGPALFKRENSFLFRKNHLHAAKDFYEKKGAGMIVLARFLPIIRTFAPIVAGIVQMDSKKFLFYNIIGAISWIVSMILTGYYLGKFFPWIGNHLEIIIIGIILITTMPVIISYLKSRIHIVAKDNKK